MPGRRIIDPLLVNTTFPEAVSYNAEILTDWDGLVWARPIPVKLLGNSWFQGSYDSVTWDNFVKDNHDYLRVSTDGGVTWRVIDLTNEDAETHPELTLGVPANGLELDIVNQTLTLELATTTSSGAMSVSDKQKLDSLKFDFLDNIGTGYELYKNYTDSVDERTHNLRTLSAGTGISLNYVGDTIEISYGGGGVGVDNQGRNIGLTGVSVFDSNNSPYIDFRSLNSNHTGLTISLDSGNNALDFDLVESNIDHDLLNNYVSNEHIDHSTVSILTEEGIQGGGDLTTTRTLSLDFNGLSQKVTVEDTDLFALYDPNTSIHYKMNYQDLVDGVTEVHNTYYVPLTTSINTGVGLIGGGTLDVDRTIRLGFNNLPTVTPDSTDYLAIYDSSNVNHAKISVTSIASLIGSGIGWYLSDGGISTKITDSETVTFSGDGQYISTSRSGNEIIISGIEQSSVIEDVAFDFNDVSGISQTYILDIDASFDFDIKEVVIQSDSNISFTLDVGASTVLTNTSTTSVVTHTVNSPVVTNDQITLNLSNSAATLIRGKLRIQRT